jgi:hypothetical protein
MADGVRFVHIVLAGASYGSLAGFRAGLTERGLTMASGHAAYKKVYPADLEHSVPAHLLVKRPTEHLRLRGPGRVGLVDNRNDGTQCPAALFVAQRHQRHAKRSFAGVQCA